MKAMKKGMALGALMAFVITGNAMAAEINDLTLPTKEFGSVKDFQDESGLEVLKGGNEEYGFWCNYYCADQNNELPNKLVTTGSIKYTSEEYGGHMGLFAGLCGVKQAQNNANPDGNILEIKHNLEVGVGQIYLYGGGIGNGSYVNTAKDNSVFVGIENNPITIKAGSDIFISGALGNNSSTTIYDVKDNYAEVDNVNFIVPEGSYVCVYGAEARSGSAEGNEVLIKNTNIADYNANIFGAFVWNKAGNAISNTITFNNVTLGDKAECAGGYVYGVDGNADENTINIVGNSKIAGILYGGYSANNSASGNTINIKDTADVSNAKLFGDNDKDDGTGNTLNIEGGWVGAIGSVENFDVINIDKDAVVTLNNGMDCSDGTTNINGAILELGGATKIGILDVKNDSKVVFGEKGHLDVNDVSGSLIITEAGKTADDLNTAEQLTTVAAKLGVSADAKETVDAKVVMAAGAVKGETSGDVVFETKHGEYFDGVVKSVTEKVNTTNASIAEMHSIALMAWRAENNDMHKRLGELRDANGEHGAWVRMTRGESEYESVKNQYNAYQMGYDQKAGDWTVGAAVTYTEGETGFSKGSGENDHTGFAVYGSKLNNDGTYIDLIAKYAKLDHKYTVNGGIGSGDYDTDGLALSAEYGKRFEKGNGLWIEPQVELTYGQVDSVDFEAENGTVSLDNMNSLVGRVGFRAGKDIKDGNVYVRASYLYDFEGETDIAFSDGTNTRRFEQDLGGGWWEVGVGANINLSKATYIYADVEHACGGEVDTDWKWNLGVRYSF